MPLLHALLIALPLILLTACGATRVALPMPASEVVAQVGQLSAVGPDDRIRVSRRSDGRHQLTIDHRDDNAAIKKVSATSVIAVRALSLVTSEALVRSDRVGWLWTWRDRQQEAALVQDLRAWAMDAAEPPPGLDEDPESDVP